MQMITADMANRVLKLVEAGADATSTQFSDILNELINYMIFVEAASVSKYLLGLLCAGLAFRAFSLFVLSAETEEKKNYIRGWRNIIVSLLTLITLYSSFNSILNLGKVLFAPKIYIIEAAIEKVKEVKGVTK